MDKISRRTFLLLTGGTGAAFVGKPGRKLVDRLIPYVIPPEEPKPGEWAHYATACRECPAGCGMALRHRDGRVTKAEGIADHPVNGGALCARGQSAPQGLYDPDRLRRIIDRSEKTPSKRVDWSTAVERIASQLKEKRGKVAILSDLQTGALAEVMEKFAGSFGPGSVLRFFEPFNYESLRRAHESLVGLPVVPEYRLDGCDFILSFAADFLETWISPVGFARQFGTAHSLRNGAIGRFAYLGPRLSMTAANADDFCLAAETEVRAVALSMLKVMIDRGWARPDLLQIRPAVEAALARGPGGTRIADSRIEALARSFALAENSVALAGSSCGTGPIAEDIAAAALLLNYAAGRVGKTVDFRRPHALSRTATGDQVRALLSGLGPDDTLIIHNANPVYAMRECAADIDRAGTVVVLGTMEDETSKHASFVLPIDYPLESWGDYEPSEGIHGRMQPTMARLHDTRSAGDILLAVARASGRPLSRSESRSVGDFEDWLRQRWEELRERLAPEAPDVDFWRDSLRRGGFWESRVESAAPPAFRLADFRFNEVSPREAKENSANLWCFPSIMLFDGRLANRGWLQEAPDPTTTITWDSWIDIHPGKALELALTDGDILELSNRFGKLEAPVRITEEVEGETVALAFGRGHEDLGRHARGGGANAFSLLGNAGGEAGTFGRVSLRKTGKRLAPAATCGHLTQSDRDLLQWTALSKVRSMKPGEGNRLILPLPEGYDRKRDLYPPREYKKYRWAMVIDLQKCIGCGACAVACYAENNLAVVGRVELTRGHEMPWLRVIPYRSETNPLRVGFLPLLCHHCDAAPCEPVCPVFASVHNEEGLNAQIFNRCVGTRYCSNNCPYKVRRFNFQNTEWVKPLDWQLNPEVTVRCRGVMEKCTFCVQRIRQAEFKAMREDRSVREGEIVPACVQTCPTKAFAFGNLLDSNSRVTRLTREDPRRYHLLEELNTKPAVTYLRRVIFDESA